MGLRGDCSWITLILHAAELDETWESNSRRAPEMKRSCQLSGVGICLGVVLLKAIEGY